MESSVGLYNCCFLWRARECVFMWSQAAGAASAHVNPAWNDKKARMSETHSRVSRESVLKSISHINERRIEGGEEREREKDGGGGSGCFSRMSGCVTGNCILSI